MPNFIKYIQLTNDENPYSSSTAGFCEVQIYSFTRNRIFSETHTQAALILWQRACISILSTYCEYKVIIYIVGNISEVVNLRVAEPLPSSLKGTVRATSKLLKSFDVSVTIEPPATLIAELLKPNNSERSLFKLEAAQIDYINRLLITKTLVIVLDEHIYYAAKNAMWEVFVSNKQCGSWRKVSKVSPLSKNIPTQNSFTISWLFHHQSAYDTHLDCCCCNIRY